MDPLSLALGGASLAAGLFGKKKSSKPKLPGLTKEGRWMQDYLYGRIGSGISGGGFIPADRMGWGERRVALAKSYQEARPELESALGRLVPGSDIKVRNYARNVLSRGYKGTLEVLREAERTSPYEQQQTAIGKGFESLAGEYRMGMDYAQNMNDYLMNIAQMPSFGSQLAGGLGYAGMWGMMSSSGAQNYAKLMAGGF